MTYQVLQGNNIDVLKQFPDNHFDSIVTDPPYGIDFLGKAWDANVGALETYQECLRVLKPGGHILAFSAARTYHHLAITLEQAGFEIRDQIMWIYSSGFPKSQDVGKSIERGENKRTTGKGFKAEAYTGIMDTSTNNEREGGIGACSQCGKNNMAFPKNYNACEQEPCFMREQAKPADNKWAGWGTNLKPAHEPIALARKPIKGSIAKNCQQWGVGALNIDATRIAIEGEDTRNGGSNGVSRLTFGEGITSNDDSFVSYTPNDQGRFPSNVIGEIPEYQKYFYCPKVSRAERHVGHDNPGPQTARARDSNGNVLNHAQKLPGVSPTMLAERLKNSPGNNHPTVKPIDLMKYLIKLVTPAGGHVLDPFNGSGSTGCAAVEMDYDYTGIELDAKYVDIARKRIEAWYRETHPNNFTELFEEQQ